MVSFDIFIWTVKQLSEIHLLPHHCHKQYIFFQPLEYLTIFFAGLAVCGY